jgi:glycolate oxidase FAD binding subunit
MTVASHVAIGRLESAVGVENVLVAPDGLHRCAIAGAQPGAIVTPGSAAEVVEIVRIANDERLALCPVGAGTKLEFGPPPDRCDVAVELSRMSRIADYDPGDLTLSVEPGLPVPALAAALTPENQFVPLEGPCGVEGTVGGTLAAGVSGPLRQAYGSARDSVLGMEFVTGYGKLVKSGGRVVKNVTGYDLHKLLIGSLGTLAIITRINLRTYPAFRARQSFMARVMSCSSALDLRRKIAQSSLALCAMDIVSPELAEAISLAPANSPGKFLCIAEVAGNEAVIARSEAEMRRAAEDAHADSFISLDSVGSRAIWETIVTFAPQWIRRYPYAAIVKITAPTGAHSELVAAFREMGAEAFLLRGPLAYVALGSRGEGKEEVLHLCERLHAAAEAAEGQSEVEWSFLEARRLTAAWLAQRRDFALMQKLKDVFDPGNTLCPGRFAGAR